MENFVSLAEIASLVNNVNLDQEIVVFDYELNPNSKVFPARFDAFFMITCVEGEGRIGIDMREYEIRPDSLIVLYPQNFVYLTRASEHIRVKGVALSRRIEEEVLPKFTDLLPLIMHQRSQPVTHFNPEDARNVRAFYEFLHQKLRGPKTPFLKKKVICLLQAALFEIMDVHLENAERSNVRRTRKEEVMARFLVSVSENFRNNRQVTYYANKLCITPKHLSAVVKEISNRTAGEWIDHYVTMEAKVLLKTTDMTIQEIATKLNFANQSFFGKYFKYQTGFSPTQFRKMDV